MTEMVETSERGPRKSNRLTIAADGVIHVRDIPPGHTVEQIQAEFWKERQEKIENKRQETELLAKAKDATTWRNKDLHDMNRYELEEYAKRLNPPMSYERRWPISTGISNIVAHKEKWGIIDKAPVHLASPPPGIAPRPKNRGGRPRKNPLPEPPAAA